MNPPLLLLAALLAACPLAAQKPDVAPPAPAAQPAKAVELVSTYKLEFDITGPGKESATLSLASTVNRFALNSLWPTIQIEGELAELADGRLRLWTKTNFTTGDGGGGISSKASTMHRSELQSTVIVRPGQNLELFKNKRHTLSVTITRVE